MALDLGAALVVPLPLPPSEYERDFPASVVEFRALCDRAQTIRRIDLPALDTSGTRPAE